MNQDNNINKNKNSKIKLLIDLGKMNTKRNIFDSRNYYKPFDYPQFAQAAAHQTAMIWSPFEVYMTADKVDYNENLTNDEREIVRTLLIFLTQAEHSVSTSYIKLLQKFQLPELQKMFITFANIESIHTDGYLHLLNALGISHDMQEVTKLDQIHQKISLLTDIKLDTEYNTLLSIAVISAYIEGLSFFSAFYTLLLFQLSGVLNGQSQIVTWIRRDELLHTQKMALLFQVVYYHLRHSINEEQLINDIHNICKKVVDLELKFIDLVIKGKTMRNLSKIEIETYIKHLADKRTQNLGIPSPNIKYDMKHYPKHHTVMEVREHVDFFNIRPTEYKKPSKSSSWSEDIIY